MTTDRRADMAAWTKANLPTCVSVASAFRAAFGDVRMVFASEGGHSVGAKGEDGVKLSETHVGRLFHAETGRR